jgi:hypothetical protein
MTRFVQLGENKFVNPEHVESVKKDATLGKLSSILVCGSGNCIKVTGKCPTTVVKMLTDTRQESGDDVIVTESVIQRTICKGACCDRRPFYPTG